jgi:hypothetical protein
LNLLDLVPQIRRHIGQYLNEDDTDSKLAAYLADGVEALVMRWGRPYTITVIAPESYSVLPDIAVKDKRAVVLMASIIYKSAKIQLSSFSDQDFSWNPHTGAFNPISLDVAELSTMVPKIRLAKSMSGSLRGFGGIYNPESYNWLDVLSLYWP